MTFLTATINDGEHHFRRVVEDDGTNGDYDDRPHVRPRDPSDPEKPVVQTWQLLAAIAAIMAVLLGAHYAFVMASVKEMLHEHELTTSKLVTEIAVKLAEEERRVTLLEIGSQQGNERDAQLRAEIDRIDREIAVIRERQDQVRAKLGMTGR